MWEYLQKIIRNYFGFSQREVNGTIVLFVILAILIALPLLESYFLVNPTHTFTDKAYQDSIVAYLESLHTETEPPLPEIELAPFDPNQLTKDEWIRLGVPEKVAQRIENYHKKGGRFRKKEDLLRIYDFPEDLYHMLEPFIVVETKILQRRFSTKPSYTYKHSSKDDTQKHKKPKPNEDTSRKQKKYQAKLNKFDLNQADTSQLKTLRGIGEKRALTIIKYRERLGGFASIEQIEEIWGLDSTAVANLKKYTYITPNSWKKIAINSANLEELKKHPYIGARLASVIINYRLQHGPFKSENDLTKIKTLDENTLRKFKPYIVFD